MLERPRSVDNHLFYPTYWGGCLWQLRIVACHSSSGRLHRWTMSGVQVEVERYILQQYSWETLPLEVLPNSSTHSRVGTHHMLLHAHKHLHHPLTDPQQIKKSMAHSRETWKQHVIRYSIRQQLRYAPASFTRGPLTPSDGKSTSYSPLCPTRGNTMREFCDLVDSTISYALQRLTTSTTLDPFSAHTIAVPIPPL